MREAIEEHLVKKHDFTKDELASRATQVAIVYIESFHDSVTARALAYIKSEGLASPKKKGSVEIERDKLAEVLSAYAEEFNTEYFSTTVKALNKRERAVAKKEKDVVALKKTLREHIDEYQDKSKESNLDKHVDRRLKEILSKELAENKIEELLKLDAKKEAIPRTVRVYAIRWIRDQLKKIVKNSIHRQE